MSSGRTTAAAFLRRRRRFFRRASASSASPASPVASRRVPGLVARILGRLVGVVGVVVGLVLAALVEENRVALTGIAARDVLELDLLLQGLDDGLAAVHQGELVELVLELAELVLHDLELALIDVDDDLFLGHAPRDDHGLAARLRRRLGGAWGLVDGATGTAAPATALATGVTRLGLGDSGGGAGRHAGLGLGAGLGLVLVSADVGVGVGVGRVGAGLLTRGALTITAATTAAAAALAATLAGLAAGAGVTGRRGFASVGDQDRVDRRSGRQLAAGDDQAAYDAPATVTLATAVVEADVPGRGHRGGHVDGDDLGARGTSQHRRRGGEHRGGRLDDHGRRAGVLLRELGLLRGAALATTAALAVAGLLVTATEAVGLGVGLLIALGLRVAWAVVVVAEAAGLVALGLRVAWAVVAIAEAAGLAWAVVAWAVVAWAVVAWAVVAWAVVAWAVVAWAEDQARGRARPRGGDHDHRGSAHDGAGAPRPEGRWWPRWWRLARAWSRA